MRKTTLIAIALALMLMMALAPLTLAQDIPPTWKPPTIDKSADKSVVEIGETLVFTIVVVNPGTPDVDATWYNVRLTDVLNPALRIDSVTTTMGTATVTGQTVVVNGGITLPPGAYFTVEITCTLQTRPSSGVIVNIATLEYTNAEDDPQPPVSDDTRIRIPEVPPVIPEASTLLLLGSAATGMAGYVGLQIRARRRRES